MSSDSDDLIDIGASDEDPPDSGLADRIYWALLIVFQAAMGVEAVLLLIEQQWLNAALVLGIMVVVIAPAAIAPRLHVRIPAEFQALAVVFMFASLFLGETLNYYQRFVWWDTVLHAFSGLLLGVFGFLLVYVLNENRRIELTLRPGFVALFAFLFAVAVGTLWEIFEFSVDQLIGQSMQSGGLSDTMWDLIADTVTAAAISVFGWWYLLRPERSFIERWVEKFIRRNPRLFRERSD
ncbi:MAG: hypothetical protein ACTSWI_02485 [Alphaproteobacteria bacterium]